MASTGRGDTTHCLGVPGLATSNFPDRHISLKTAVPWAPRSPDLNPNDFVIWGCLNDRVYAEKPSTTDERLIKIAIVEEVARMPVDTVHRAIAHPKDVRLPLVKDRRGAHLEHLLQRA